jgi:hypothetical protein
MAARLKPLLAEIAQVAAHEFAQAETFIQFAHQNQPTIRCHP